MDSFWIKIVILAAVVLGLVFLVRMVDLPKTEPEEQKSLSQILEKKDESFHAPPEPIEQPETQVQEVEQISEANLPEDTPIPAPPPTPQFMKLSEAEEIEASQLLEKAITMRKTAHVTMGAGYKTTVELCREIIKKFPDSEYALKAKRILDDIPDRIKERFNVTEDEVKSEYYK